MATKAEVIDFLKLWYSGDVKTIEDFRRMDPKCKAKADFQEGNKTTYPAGYDNGSLNQKAHRYVCRDDKIECFWQCAGGVANQKRLGEVVFDLFHVIHHFIAWRKRSNANLILDLIVPSGNPVSAAISLWVNSPK